MNLDSLSKAVESLSKLKDSILTRLEFQSDKELSFNPDGFWTQEKISTTVRKVFYKGSEVFIGTKDEMYAFINGFEQGLKVTRS